MKVGIMQPYFFPYIGYWQLINAVDKYVIYDDVNYIKSGWINRNNILINGMKKSINLKLKNASSNKLVNEIEILKDTVYISKFLRSIKESYSKAPYFKNVFSLIEDIISQEENNLAKYLTYSIQKICAYLGINTEIIVSSEMDKNNSLKGQDKVIHICEMLGADTYINTIGGIELYNKVNFFDNGINLKFLKSGLVEYRQFSKDEFIPHLSIIDLMMFNSKEDLRGMLNSFKLV